MKKLIGMVDFVMQESSNQDIVSFAQKVYDYANFMSQKLEIWMFVPCKLVDGVWVVLEEPNIENEKYRMIVGEEKENILDLHSFDCDVEEYQQAKERCLFDGFKYNDGYLINGMNCINTKLHQTIEDLVKYNLELTKTAQL